MDKKLKKEWIIKSENSHLKEDAINSVLSVSDDKLKEVTNIIDLLNCPVLTNDDVKSIKWFLLGRLKGKLED